MIAGWILLLLAPSAAVQEAELKAQQALASGRTLEGLESLEEAIRLADDTPTKARLRDAYLKAGWADPLPLSELEGQIVTRHIREERIRVWELGADRMENAGKLPGAILVRRGLMELLGPQEDRVKAQQDRIAEIVRKMLYRPTDEEKEVASRAEHSCKDAAAAVGKIRDLLAKKSYVVAIRLCQAVEFGDGDQEQKNAARALRTEIEERAAADVPPDQKEEARGILNDERFERIDLVRSRHFLLFGPKVFVQAIPHDQRTLLDLAYIFQSDLAQMPLTADGTRICVYYQETFDFGGGLAGGKLIRIGNRAIRPPVAGMLHYHELGHCIFGRGWLHDGFTEGLADFAAGFTLDALGRTQEAEHFITGAKDQFVRYFLGRDVRYFHIQPYQPSAGFLFSFLPPKEAPYDWAPYRRVFHRMREAQFGDWPEREHQIMRYFGYLMATEYGPEVLDRLADWGWPVCRADFARVAKESETYLAETKQGEFQLIKENPVGAEERFRNVLQAHLGSHLDPRAGYGMLLVALGRGDTAEASALAERLGIVREFKVLGPFHARGRTAHVVFPPESGRVNFAEPVRFGIETAVWKTAVMREDGYCDFLKQGYGYPENACAFAVAYLRAEEAGPARFWLGSDDGHALWLNGRLLEKRDVNRRFEPDDDFADAALERGWNRVMVKVHNTNGEWGFLLRVTRPDNAPVPGLEVSIEPHEADLPGLAADPLRPVPELTEEFRGLSPRWETTVGKFDTQNGKLRPLGTEKVGLWQRFLVDPDKPKDGPANILWLLNPPLPSSDAFELEVVVVPAGKGLPAKFAITVDGEGENDAQSGHTFVVEPEEKNLLCNWYRYDRLLYLQPGVEVPLAESYSFLLRREGSRWWLSANGVPLFEGVDAPRLPACRIGLQAWGREPLFESFRLARLEPRPR